MAFGLGFIFGPPLGSISYKFLGHTGPGWVAMALCAANFFLAFSILPESRKGGSEHAQGRPRLAQWGHTLAQPKIGLLITVFFLATFCFTCFEWTLGLLIAKNFHLDHKVGQAAVTSGILFMYCGIVGAAVQGGAIGRLVKSMGEPKLIATSLVLVALSLVALPFVHGNLPLSWRVFFYEGGGAWILLFLVLGLLAIGSGLTRPPVFGMISNLTPPNEQGATIGVAQSAGSLARIFGPIFATTLFAHHPALPYVICGVISLMTALIAWQALCRSEEPLVAPQHG
jgi:predicted MFS family arabinose efflux permease